MGLNWPKYPTDVSDGDDVSHGPRKNDRSLLGTERGTDYTRRLETDSNRNLHVNVANDSRRDTLLYSATLGPIAASTPTAFVAYTAGTAVKVYKVLISGAAYSDFNLRHLGSSIGIKLTNHEMQVEFDFPHGYDMAVSDTMDAVVEHCVTGQTKSYNIYIYGE